MNEPLSEREAIETASTLLGRELSQGETAMIARMTAAGITITDLMTILDKDVPEPEAGEYRYEAQGQRAVQIP
jgi:hypothetical protein